IAVSLTHNIVNTAILPFFREYCGPVGMARYALPGSKELSENISAVFAQGYTNVMLENHGIIMGGDSLEEIYKRFEILELCANVMIDTAFLASGVSVKADKSESYHDFFKVNTGESNQLNKEFIQERKNLLQYVSRVHQKKLSPSAFFSISSVLEGNRMLILNPSPGYAAEQSDNFSVIDISTAAQTDENGLSALHKAIYARNKNIGCIMLATPPSIMAFACSKFVFNPHVIPEAYMVLRQVKTLQHGLIRSPERIAGEITGRSDVFIVKNGFVMICAKDPIKAYDRLEVLEFSARALIDAKRLGVVHYIQDSDIKKLENAFTL
ncbi:MAG: class II aldolase/adducin family protein, partial [Acetanaerobacterium sp.]